MVEIEVDGKKVEIAEGSVVMHAANKLGIYVPHFCYHKKLSIAASCRMCLVEVEKAPKPMPACATPVANGMKVHTRSEKAIAAQRSVMEFLLVNHPLDCPICDQGGECQLQDLAVGYGAGNSHYHEAKRVVIQKSLGPLISAQEMNRCIHCTRCVRFGQEIAGDMELGMAFRGEHAEIMSFLGRSVDSELSGNMIDICPVGALTSKPFRYSARNWELARRKSIAPHDSLGSNLVVQVKAETVKRVVPLENEAINECWISDKDRFSYEGLNSDERLRTPMLKHGGAWHEVDWQTALDYVQRTLTDVRKEHGAAAIGALGSPHSTVEELFLLQKLVRALGSDNVDFRLRQADFSADATRSGAPWLGMNVEELNGLDRLLVVGSFLRKDHPLIAGRIRQAVKRGAEVSVLHALDDQLLMPVANKAIIAPARWAAMLSEVLVALLRAKQVALPAALAGVKPSPEAAAIAGSLASGAAAAVLLGNAAIQHPQAALIARLAGAIAAAADATFGVLGEAANSVGGYLAGATPKANAALNAAALGDGGLDAGAMISGALAAYLLLNVEPSCDHANPAMAAAALAGAKTVIALSQFKSEELLTAADCLLPIAAFTETAGTFVNTEGLVQSFNGVSRAPGEARPAWKVLRVLGNQFGLDGFDFDSPEQVRDAALAGDVAARLDNAVGGEIAVAAEAEAGLERLAEVPIYFADPLVRRAASLQKTRDARPPVAAMSSQTAAALGLRSGDKVRVAQKWAEGEGEATLDVVLDDGVAAAVVRVAAAHASTAGLAGMFGPVTVRKA
ncbi:MAG: NADH-quinone oxidoreductase subunit NuoG [Burkholderiaceae bacterium]|nr:NADH-quinone oxidoreductase subunit NuoG [Burkholderiaceae bacterium]